MLWWGFCQNSGQRMRRNKYRNIYGKSSTVLVLVFYELHGVFSVCRSHHKNYTVKNPIQFGANSITNRPDDNNWQSFFSVFLFLTRLTQELFKKINKEESQQTHTHTQNRILNNNNQSADEPQPSQSVSEPHFVPWVAFFPSDAHQEREPEKNLVTHNEAHHVVRCTNQVERARGDPNYNKKDIRERSMDYLMHKWKL